MQNYITTFTTDIDKFGVQHPMLKGVEWIRSETDLDNMVFDKKTIVFMIDSANINNEDGSPVYEVRFITAVIDKGMTERRASSWVVEESLFVISQLQDYVQNIGWSVIFGEVDIQTDFDNSGELVVLSTSFTAQFSRGLCANVDSVGFSGYNYREGYHAPVINGIPSIVGDFINGNTVSVVGADVTAQPYATISYKWQRRINGSSTWDDIVGATTSSYILENGDVGNYIRVVQIASSKVGSTEANSNASQVLDALP